MSCRPHRPEGIRRNAATSSKRRTILASLAVVAVSLVLFELVCWAVLGPPVRLKATRGGRDVQTAYDVQYGVGADGLRPVCTSDRDAAAQQAVVSFIGDSFTFGQGVGDQNNFVHLLSCQFADLSFVNFGAIGVGLEYYLEITHGVLPHDARAVFVIMYENDVVAPGWTSTRARIKRFIKASSYLYFIYHSLERWIDLGSAAVPVEKVGGKYNNPKSVAGADPDFLRAWTSPAAPALAAFRSAIRDLLDAIEDAAPAATIFMAMVPEASTVSRPVREFYRDLGVSFLPAFGVRSETYRAAMEACSGRCRFIDIYPSFLRHGAEVYFDTDFHWNEAGHALMADLLTPYLEGLSATPEDRAPDARLGPAGLPARWHAGRAQWSKARRCAFPASDVTGGSACGKGSAMNWDQIKGNWKQFQGQAKQQWGKLTDDDLTRAEGDRDILVGRIQERYGLAREEADRQVAEWERRL